MRIIQITQSFFSHGAVMKRARQETKALISAGHKVIIITDLRWTSHLHDLEKYKGQILIVPIKPIYIVGFRNISSQLSFSFKTYLSLKRLIQRKKIELIISHSATVCYAVAPIANKKNIAAFWVIQDLIRDRMLTGNPYNWWETQMFLHSNFYALRKMPYLMAVSERTKKLAILDGAEAKNISVIYNAVDTSLFVPNWEEDKEIDILFFGRLSIEKGVDILIEATKYFSKKRHIVIVGEGPLSNILKKKADKINQNIEFLGFINHSDLPDLIPKSKLVITPSRSECHASVPIESMACGVPVLASNVSGMPDTIQDGKSGWILKKNDPITLSKKIEEILDNSEKLNKISKIAYKRSNYFSEERFKDKIVTFYENIVNEHKKKHL